MSQDKDVILGIIDSCYSLDKDAVEIYEQLSSTYSGEELGSFWRQMAKEEKEHIAFWEGLLPLAEQGAIPQLFDRPYEVESALENSKKAVAKLKEDCCTTAHANKGFLIAYRLEFYLLHPAFELLFHFAENLGEVVGLKTPEEGYEEHIDKFIVALNQYGKVTSEMELLGEVLLRLWEENKRLAIQGSTDTLTDVLNRRGFFQAIKPLAHFAKRNKYLVGTLMIDIDHFKKVNDTHGHQKGDNVLISVANAIKSSLRGSDILGRYGGEEFTVFMPRLAPDSVSMVGEKIRQAVSDETYNDIHVTVSVGGCEGNIGSELEESIDEFIKKADVCLYEAKRTGRNKVVCRL
jgi:diguanylate cyclase (GGDEF)-like protein